MDFEFKRNLSSLLNNRFSVLYVYSDLRYFGKFRDVKKKKDEFLSNFLTSLLEFCDTICMPTFSYTDFGTFNCRDTESKLGALNRAILKNPDNLRSDHPIFSFAALGKDKQIVENIGLSAFGKDSIHDRLLGKNAAFLYIGRPTVAGNTLIHYVEQRKQVNYRFEKTFSTNVFCGQKFIGSNFSAYVRKKDNPDNAYYFNFRKANEYLLKKKLINEIASTEKFSNISIIPYDSCFENLTILLNQDSKAFISE